MAQGLGSKTCAEPTHGDGWGWKKMGMILIVIYCSYIKQNTTVVTSFPCDSLLNSLSLEIRLSNMLKIIIILVRHRATQGYNCFFNQNKIMSVAATVLNFFLSYQGRCVFQDGASGMKLRPMLPNLIRALSTLERDFPLLQPLFDACHNLAWTDELFNKIGLSFIHLAY